MSRALLLGGVLLLPACGDEEDLPLRFAYLVTPLAGAATIYADVQWPAACAVSSPFGPRLRASAGFTYEFHKGVDIPGNLGDPVTAAADGEVYRTYAEGDPDSPYPNGGNVVVLRHAFDTPFPLQGMSHAEYYSLYLHLDAMAVGPVTGGPCPAIAKGAAVGTLGHTGTTAFDHLHFEIRVGTLCSREYQLANPADACASYFGEARDPHVNPMRLLGYPDLDTLQAEIVGVGPLRIRIRSDRNELDLNEVRASYAGAGKIVNFDTRGNIDPAEPGSPTYGGVILSPAVFSASSPLYEITITFTTLASFDVIEVRDIHGKGLRLSRT
jgi:hypothetical protein